MKKNDFCRELFASYTNKLVLVTFLCFMPMLAMADVSIDETNFPDTNFRDYISGNFDKNLDGTLDEGEISEAMTMFVFNEHVASLTGIEYFTALQILYCTGTQITSLDLSKCTALTTLECYDNAQLATLDVSGCKALTSLNCSGGKLTSLDVTELTLLTNLNCNGNSLTSLDVSNNADLKTLRCSYLQLTHLDVTKNKKLEELFCTNNQLTELDLSQNPELKTLFCYNNQLTTLDVSKNTKLVSIMCYSNCIGEDQMGKFVESLTYVEEGYLTVINTLDNNEKNVINKDQVTSANTKGWEVLDQHGNNPVIIEGSDPGTSQPEDGIAVENADGITIYYNFINDGTELEVVYGKKVNGEDSYVGDVVIPEEVTYEGKTLKVTAIGDGAFGMSIFLTSVTIPKSVTSIGRYLFYGSGEVSSVIVEDGNTVYDSRENCNAVIETESNTLIAGCKNSTIPASVTSIGEYAFWTCLNLTSVTIPDNVISIENFAFYQCNNLTSVSIGDGVTSIGESAFEECVAITSLNLGNNITTIGSRAFMFCRGIASVTIPNSVTSIDSCAFYGCDGITTLIIGNNVATIGKMAFQACVGLTTLTIPNSVGFIGDDAFMGCGASLTSIVVEEGNKTFDSRDNCNALIETASNTLILGCMNTIVPDGVTTIGDKAFSICINLKSLTIPEGVTYIGSYAFNRCSSLTSLTLPKSLTSIGNNAFEAVDFQSVSSLIEDPFEIVGTNDFNRTFSTNTYKNATLYVPIGTIDKYKATKGWKDFVNIEEMGESGISHVEAQTSDAPYYNLNGQRIAQPKKGIYIQNGKKLVIK